ncbi:MAG TPA: ketopantoate reductase C-terminal domain-containing protein, partial [Burkholderiales bacterium]
VVARGAHLEAMRRNGVKLLHGDEIIQGKVGTGDPGPQDAVFVTLKANMLGSFAEAASPLLGPDTAVVFAQNGIPWWYPAELPRLDPGGKLHKHIPMRNVVGAAVYSANEVVEPGVIRNFVPNNNMLVIGQASGRDSARTQELRRVIEDAGISSPPTDDIRRSVWAKLVQNLANSSLCLLTEMSISDVVADPQLRELKSRVSAEARAIAAALGVDTDKAPTRPGGGHASGALGHKPSMLQDYERGRPMEVEAQLMAPLALARAAKLATPTLDVLVPLAARKAAAKGLYQP